MSQTTLFADTTDDSAETKDKKSKRGGGFSSTADLLAKYQYEQKPGYISQEFQDYGYRLAVELDDLPHKSLYIRLAKKEKRGLLEQARSFVVDSGARSKAKLFMWKLKQLRAERKEKEKAAKQQVGASTAQTQSQD